jgi:hypothetical protein
MLLSCRILTQVSDPNAFNYADEFQMTQGDTARIYFQLVDLSQDKALQQFKPVGRRFCPATGATLQVVLDNIDDAIRVTRAATQAFPTADSSIWYVDLLATDKISGTVNMALTLTEPGPKVTKGRAEAVVSIAIPGCL